MKPAFGQPARCQCALFFLPLTVLALCLYDPSATPAALPRKGGGGTAWMTVVRVEEDRKPVILESDAVSSQPQINSVISPFGKTDSNFNPLELNQHCIRGDESGALQTQVWQGNSCVAQAKSIVGFILPVMDETILWYQSKPASSAGLNFEANKGLSSTWINYGTDTTPSDNATVIRSAEFLSSASHVVQDHATQSNETTPLTCPVISLAASFQLTWHNLALPTS